VTSLVLVELLLHHVHLLERLLVLSRKVLHVKAGAVPNAPGEPENQCERVEGEAVVAEEGEDVAAEEEDEVAEEEDERRRVGAELLEDLLSPILLVVNAEQILVVALPDPVRRHHEVDQEVERRPQQVEAEGDEK